MKTKKLISLFCAAAMTVSSFAGLTITASAAVGDVLINQNFDDADNTTPWGTPVEQSATAEGGTVTWNKVIGTAYVDSATLGTVPASVTGNVFNFSSDGGNNSPTGTVTIDAATGTAQAYNVSFDAYIKNAKKDSYGDLNGADSPEEAYEYIFGFGDGTNDVIRFDVKGQDIYFVSNGVNIDTGIKTGAEGVWVKADVKCDVASKSVKGTITPEGGEAANLDASFSASGASSISKLYAASIRFSGNTKGYINNYIDNFVVTEAAPIVPCNITINQKCGETVLATETVKGGIGESYTVGASYKVPFATEQSREAGKYYKYDETSIDTIVAAEGSVIDLNFVETDMPTVTVKATTGDSMTPVASMAEVRGVPGEKPTIYISEYVKSTDDKWYQKDDKNTGGRGDMYNVSVEITADDSDKLIPYKPAFNVVSFLEAEDSENVVESDDGLAGGTYNTDYIRDYASGGVWAQSTTGTTYPTGFYTAPVAEAGTYEITVRTHDMKRTAAIAKVAADDTMTKIGQTTYDSGIAFTTVKADLEAGEKIWVGKNGEIGTDDASASTKLINDVDYIVVKDANRKADTDPVVTFNYANKVASLTSDKDRTVKAVVIHAQYGGGILTDVKQHPVDILSGAAPTTVNIEEPVYEGDKFMVWETLDGLKPLLVPAYTVPQGSGDAKPKFTVTVAEGIANGTVTPDKAQAEQGETVTLTVTPAQGYVLDTLTVKDADNADITVTNNTFTMPAKNVTVTATFKAQIAGTVTIAGTAKVGETITATVAELPAGATAKYQWQLATAQEGEFTDVQGANEASKKLSSVSQDKYVRVVVTADGFDGQLVSNVLGPVGEAAAPITKYAITKVVDPADTATVTTTIGDGTAVDEVTDGINVTVNATATGDNAVKEIVVTETEGGAPVAFNAETKTFKMPAKAVTVTVKTAPLFAITKAAAENGSFTVSADKAAEGTAITVTPTANEGYKVDTVKFNDTVIEAEDGAYSFTMPAMAVTVTVTFADTAPVPVVSYDFDGDGAEVGFADTSRITREIVADDTEGTANNTKVLKFTNAANAGNGMALAKLNFADAVQNATSVKVEFDTYAAGGGRANFSLFDGSVRGFDGNTYTKASYNTTGVLFAQGSDANDAYKVRNNNAAIAYGKWTHTVVEIDYVTQKISYTVTAAGEEAVTAENVDYLDANAKYATGLELYSWVGNAVSYIDNVKVFAEIGTGNTVTINYVDGEGNVVKEAKTVAAVNTLPYTVDAAEKATFEANDARYTYKADESTDTIAAVSDEAKTITLVFDKAAYQTTTFTVKLADTAKAGVAVKVAGTPTDTTAAAVNTTVTTGDDGTATIKLLPGTYTYAIDQTTEYLEVAETAITVGQNNDVALTANAKQGTKITVKYMLADVVDPVKTAEITENVYVGESYTVADSYKNAFTIADEAAGTFKRYTYVAEGSSDLTITEPVAENNDITIMVATDGIDYYVYEDYENLDATTEGVVEIGGWKSGNKDRYLVNVTNDSTKYINVTAVGNGNNGTTVTNASPVVAATENWIMEFDLALIKSSNQASAFAVKSETGNVMVLQQTAADVETFTLNGDATPITLTSGKFYHYKLEKVDTGVKVTITDGDTSIVDGVVFANDTATNSTEFAAAIKNDGINGMQYNTKRYCSGIKFDNMKVYKPTE